MPFEPARPYEFGDIVLVRFPFTNLASTKQRPAVVVSSREYNLTLPDIVLMAITSRLRVEPALGEVKIQQWQQANLLKPSAIKPLFATIEQTIVIKPMGVLQLPDREVLRRTIKLILR